MFYNLVFPYLVYYSCSPISFLYERSRRTRWFSWATLSLVLLNFLVIKVSYAIDPGFIDYAGRIITGPQGRYFTPFLLFLGPVFTLLAKKITVKSGPALIHLLVVMSVFASFLI